MRQTAAAVGVGIAIVVIITYCILPWIPFRSGRWGPLSAPAWTATQEWIRACGGEANGAIGGVEVDDTFGRNVSQVYSFASAESSMDERVPRALVVELGVPCQWVVGWRVRQPGGNDLVIGAADGSWAPRWTREMGGIVPLQVMWFEFAVNVTLVSALIGVLMYGPSYYRALRSRYRRRTGSCEICGFPLRGVPQCPECGSVALVEVPTGCEGKSNGK